MHCFSVYAYTITQLFMHCVKVYVLHYAAVYALRYGLCMTKKWHERLAILQDGGRTFFMSYEFDVSFQFVSFLLLVTIYTLYTTN
jgi:hypothetical protein